MQNSAHCVTQKANFGAFHYELQIIHKKRQRLVLTIATLMGHELPQTLGNI